MDDHLPKEVADHLFAQDLVTCPETMNSEQEKDRVLEHLIHCRECREQLLMLRQVNQPEAIRADNPEYDRLLRLGEQVAEDVWFQQQGFLRSMVQKHRKQYARLKYAFRPPALIWAVAMLLLAVAVPTYLYYRSDQAAERVLLSLHKVWTGSRPLEIRVTGGFPYLPYSVTRGGRVQVDQGQLLAATAELAREVADRPTPRARHLLGRLHLLKGEITEAEEQLKLVVKDEPKNPQALVDLASVYYERGVRDDSLMFLLQSADHLRSATSIDPKLAEAWFNLALCHEKLKSFSQAKSDWQRYLELDSTSPWAGEARDHLRKLLEQSKQPNLSLSERAGQLLEVAGNESQLRSAVAQNFTGISTVAWEQLLDGFLDARSKEPRSKAGPYELALTHLAEIIHSVKDDSYFKDQFDYVGHLNPEQVRRVRKIRELLVLGETAHQKGEYIKAVETFSKALSAAERSGDECHVEKAMYGLARVYTPQTETTWLASIRHRLVDTTRKRQHRQMHAKALLALANKYLTETRFSLLLEASTEAYEISNSIGDVDTSANSLRFMGNAYTGLGKTVDMLNSYFAALKLLHLNNNNNLRNCQIYTQFAGALNEQGNYQGALEYQLEALPFCKQCNDLLYASAQGRAWKYVVLSGQSERSVRLFYDASFGARKYNESTGMNSMLFDLYISLGDAYLKQNQADEAVSAYLNAIKLLGEKRSLHYQLRIYQGLALAYMRQNRLDDAERALNKGFELAEAARENIIGIDNRSAFAASRNAAYQAIVDFQYRRKKSDRRAFDYTEIHRSRELSELISQRGVQMASSVMKPSRGSAARTTSQIQRALPTDVQLIEYAIIEGHLLIWVITRTGWESVSKPVDLARLQALIADYLRALDKREQVFALNMKAKQLYRMLISPVEAGLSKDRALVFVPDGVLKAVPFAALVSPLTGHYLVEDYDLAVSPSASILVQLAELEQGLRRAQEPLLVVSNPRFSQKLFPGLSSLPGTDEELLNLNSFYSDVRQLSGRQATKKALLKSIGEFAVVHLATHSFPDEGYPLSASIVLAATGDGYETRESSVLQAHEILQLNLPKTRLVILASCHSATSERLDSPATLAQAFFSAGVPAVIGSLWEVDDSSTSRLMTGFHRAYRVERLNPCQALRQAQLAFIKGGPSHWRHPYYWAAFLLNGYGV